MSEENVKKPAKTKKVKIKILAQDNDNGDVHLFVNGKNVLIKRGEPVEIGEEYIEVLNNAVITTVVHDFDANGKKTERTLQIQRFPYQVL